MKKQIVLLFSIINSILVGCSNSSAAHSENKTEKQVRILIEENKPIERLREISREIVDLLKDGSKEDLVKILSANSTKEGTNIYFIVGANGPKSYESVLATNDETVTISDQDNFDYVCNETREFIIERNEGQELLLKKNSDSEFVCSYGGNPNLNIRFSGEYKIQDLFVSMGE